MHDYLFEHQHALDDNHLSKYATALGIDTDKFRKEMSGHNYASQIDKSLEEGIASGVEGTPTFFINGVKHNDSWDQEYASRCNKQERSLGRCKLFHNNASFIGDHRIFFQTTMGHTLSSTRIILYIDHYVRGIVT